QQEIKDALKALHDEHPSYFAVKQITQGEDYFIEANRNGILTYCGLLLNSIDKEHLAKTNTFDIPDSFWDDSDIWLPIKIQEGNSNPSSPKESVITQAGCFLAIAVSVIVFIAGIVTSISWLARLF